MTDDTTGPREVPAPPPSEGTGGWRPPAESGARDIGTPARQRRPVLVAALLSVLIAFVVAAFAGAAAGFFGARLALQRATPTGGGTISVTGQTDEPVAAAAAVAVPSVVNIDISGNETAGGTGGLPKNHPSVPIQGNGSGVAFRQAPGGGTYIITNNHVVEGANRIVVTPVSGERLRATLVGADPDTDMAVVKIDKALPVIQVADSKKLAVGDLVVAIGSPFGLEHSVTSGVISALHRSLPPSAADASGTASLVDVIQTDAAINPGNSGGALVDRKGKLVGINSAIFSASGSNDGIGFAIPVNTVVEVADQLIGSGQVRHPFLGIIGQTVTEGSAQRQKLLVTEGARVISVVKDSGAAKAGVKPDDIIVRLDDTPIRSMEDLIGAVREAGVGKTVTLKVFRAGKEISLQMTVGVKPPKL
ncbi:MAG TPA: trypsin-like peptidase domain-containing protein [Coriobacteriia bacterium]|jgi:S1-C subfamily serine protease